MTHRSTRECVLDLERAGHLRRIPQVVSPHLEMAEIHRRVYAAGGPALLFENVEGSPFPAVSNLFGTVDRARFIFRHSIERVRRIVELKVDPLHLARRPWRYLGAPLGAWTSLPRRVHSGPILEGKTTISRLPAIQSWPDDGGPFVTLPQVFTREPGGKGILDSNLGMYRIQLSGNAYERDREIGLHYQIHRGIGVHHTRALERGEDLRVSIFVGGPPAHTFAAVMPLPEGLSELVFAGMLGGRRFRYVEEGGHILSADADFCITGRVRPGNEKPEGPFGDHLGYYSLAHDFPVLEVDGVYHREDAIWPFTVVGRPPQEDTTFGDLIHDLTGPLIPTELPGIRAVNAVDAAGVHPLLLAVGSERYVPYWERQPRELLTQANAILGFGQCSLAKYLIIAAGEDAPSLSPGNIEEFFVHVLQRIDPQRDLHFQTRTTIDTLDYSGSGLNEGSKVVLAAAGEKKRDLATSVPSSLELPAGFGPAHLVFPGVLAIEGPAHAGDPASRLAVGELARHLQARGHLEGIAWISLVDDAEFTARNPNNFLWVTFTRSNPSHDIDGVGSSIENKHWGCTGPLIVDARIKPHHAPLIEAPEITRRVDDLAKRGGPLEGLY